MSSRVVAMSMIGLGAMVFASSARGQRHVGSVIAHPSGTAALRGRGLRPGMGGAPRHSRRYFAGFGFAPYFYSNDESEPEMVEEPAPPVTVVQAAQPATSPNPAESIVLELQGDHWVRITNYGQSQSEASGGSESDGGSANGPMRTASTPRRTQATNPASALPSAMLVFRDGHQEEIGKYTIVGKTIYASTEYWSSGSWTRKVAIAELDVPATLKVNRERGAKFNLPSGPNEVMVRP
jgi:hypothetical protein